MIKAAATVPAHSEIKKDLPQASFFDVFEMSLAQPEESVLHLYIRCASRTPAWVNTLMTIRNQVVSMVGLKNLGDFGSIDPNKAAESYRVGDRIGVFSVLYISDQEIVLGDSDRHLDVKVSVCKVWFGERCSVAVSTIVYIHNLLGRLYMLFVVPLHKLIVPAVMKRAYQEP